MLHSGMKRGVDNIRKNGFIAIYPPVTSFSGNAGKTGFGTRQDGSRLDPFKHGANQPVLHGINQEGEKPMAGENTGIARIRESLGGISPDQSDTFVLRKWLDRLIESIVQHPERSAFAPFHEYFTDQRPIEEHFSILIASEFSSLNSDTGETGITTFRLVLADQLSTPEAFATQSDEQLVISDLYRTLFNWLANTDVPSAINTAQDVIQNPQLAKISLPDSQPLVLFLFNAINARLAEKSYGRSLYQAVFRFAIDYPDVVAADIPDIMEANIRSVGDDNDMLHELFSEYPVLKTAYLDYLSSHYPELLEKFETRLADRIKMALPSGFQACIKAPNTPLDTLASVECP